MRKVVYIGLGGIAGAIARYLITDMHFAVDFGNFPINTLLINCLGCFLLALLVTVALEILEFSPNVRLGIATGFLGAFTTFSSVCRQTVDLFAKGDMYTAAGYLVASAVLGFGATYFGYVLAQKVILMRRKNKEFSAMDKEDE